MAHHIREDHKQIMKFKVWYKEKKRFLISDFDSDSALDNHVYSQMDNDYIAIYPNQDGEFIISDEL